MKHRVAFHRMALLAVLLLAGCGLATRAADGPSQPIGAAKSPATGTSTQHHCADLLAQSVVQVAPVHGVWNCLDPAMQARFNGTGDQAVVSASAYFLAPSTLIGCDKSVCVYSLHLEATTAAKLGISETTMTIWLDDQGLVKYAVIPAPRP